jgi:hypothetical protein
MATEDTSSVHPLTGAAAKFTAGLNFFMENPIISLMGGLLFLGLIMPPRKRKRKSVKVHHTRRNKNKQPKHLSGLRRRKKKAHTGTAAVYQANKGKRKLPHSAGRKTRKHTSSAGRPAYMVKGSKAAKDHMAALRARRKK